MTDTQTHSRSAHASNMLAIVETALFAKDRLPAVGRNPHGQDVASFHLAARPGGWAAMPFVVEGDTLMVAGYGTGGFQGIFMMKMPAPWI